MSLKTWEINGYSFELDLTDADTVERYENAFEDIDALLENNTLNDAANRYASTLVQFFPEKARE